MITTITADQSIFSYWKSLWRYRQLLFFLSWRDILVRYKQTILGLSWSVIRPLLTSLILYFIFNRVVGITSGSTPYFLIVLTGILAWQFIANTITEASSTLINNSNLITKVYFPRIFLPFSVLLVNLLDFFVTLLLLLIAFLLYHQKISLNFIFLPLLVAWLTIFSLGLSLIFSSLNVKYRDLKFLLPFAFQFLLYLSPVGFLTTKIPANLLNLYFINPVAGIIDCFRWSLLGLNPVNPTGIYISLFISILLFVAGIYIFIKTEKTLADTI